MKKTHKSRSMKWCSIAMVMMAVLLSACGSNGGNNAAGSEAAGGSNAPASTEGTGAASETVKVTTVTNWFAQAEHGGLYAALDEGIYKDAGLDMTITPGGPQISATQIVASGKAEFGMAQADEILLARQNGIPLVAVFASFQTNPQILMTHTESKISSPEDLHGKTVYVSSGAGYWEYFLKAYGLSDATQMAYTGSAAAFLADSNTVLQGYITSEPYQMKEQNIDVSYLLNADFGYNPYGNVLFTTEDYLKEHPETVKAFVEATAKGFEAFKTDYEETNLVIQQENPDLDINELKYAAETMMPLVFEGDAATNGVGYMTEERWDTLAQQMTESGLLDSKPDVSKAFTSEFIVK